MTTLDSVDDLRTYYRDPGRGGEMKVIHSVDHNCRAFLELSPFFVLATTGADGTCDASPRGGEQGFVRVLDDTHVAWADLSGNNRLDSFQNIVGTGAVGMLCMIPGMDETLRINGKASISVDPELLATFAGEGRAPKVVVVVEVAELYIHCAKALRRGGLWQPEAWPDRSNLPTVACMYRDHLAIDVDPALIEANLEENYTATMWEAGGTPPE